MTQENVSFSILNAAESADVVDRWSDVPMECHLKTSAFGFEARKLLFSLAQYSLGSPIYLNETLPHPFTNHRTGEKPDLSHPTKVSKTRASQMQAIGHCFLDFIALFKTQGGFGELI